MEMQMEFIRKLPSPQELMQDYPLGAEALAVKAARDKEIKDIFSGTDDRFILVIGPCSADNEDAVLDYVHRLAGVQEKVKDKLMLIPRVYTNKPRTIGVGYKGMLHQANPEGKEDMLAGITAIRKMHVRVVQETGLTSAEEILYPENHRYLSDILSYAAIGARSVEDQLHRMIASGVGIPVGMKNPTGGDIGVMMNSIEAAQHEQSFLFHGWEVRTKGNPLAHAILRGYVDKFGNPAVIVDANHSNSGKKYLEQIRISKDVMHSRQVSSDIRQLVKGIMIESYLEDGNQKIGGGVYGRSITDPCLGWAKSERLILELAEMV